MKKYILFSEISYSFLRQRHQIFAEILSDHFNVVFIERIPSRVPKDLLIRFIKRICTKKRNDRRSHTKDNITLVASFLAPPINKIFEFYNYCRILVILKRVNRGDIVHIFSNTPLIAKIAKNKGCIIIFDVIHNWQYFPYHNDTHRSNYKKLLEIADLVLCDSEPVISQMEEFSNIEKSKILYVPPGVEQEWFLKRDVSSIAPGKSKKIIFFGNLRANSDLSLCREISRLENTELKIYGLLDPSLGRESIEYFNQYYSGKLAIDQLVKKVGEADAILLPYDKTDLSKTIFPAKYFEALATGKPVISNSKMLHLPGWAEVVWELEDLRRIGWEGLLTSHYPMVEAKQVQIAQDNAWVNRVNNFLGKIDVKL